MSISPRDAISLEGPHVNIIAVGVLVVSVGAGGLISLATGNLIPVIVLAILGFIGMQSPKIAQQWERAIVLRLGRFHAMRGPGLFWVIPFFDAITSWID